MIGIQPGKHTHIHKHKNEVCLNVAGQSEFKQRLTQIQGAKLLQEYTHSYLNDVWPQRHTQAGKRENKSVS